MLLNAWKQAITKKKLIEKDIITASQFNLMANTLNYGKYTFDRLPAKETQLPPAWHLCYFPPRVPESSLSEDGYETDWSPPPPYLHRMWAGGELSWNGENPLRVGQNVTMESSIRDIQSRSAGRRGDSVFVWVDKKLCNNDGWAMTESRCWVYVDGKKDKEPEKEKKVKEDKKSLQQLPSSPDFSIAFKPTPKTLFRFSALTFNSHLIHYDHVYSTTVEHQKGCLTHGPLSFTLMVTYLDQFLQGKRRLASFKYRCLSPLVVNDPITILGKETQKDTFDLWVLDHTGKVAVKGTALVDSATKSQGEITS